MTKEKKGGIGRLILFVVGGIVGAVGGLLFAPRSGKETRERLKERADEAMEEGRERYETQRERMREMATEQGEVLKERVGEARGRLTQSVESASQAVRERIERGAEQEAPRPDQGPVEIDRTGLSGHPEEEAERDADAMMAAVEKETGPMETTTEVDVEEPEKKAKGK